MPDPQPATIPESPVALTPEVRRHATGFIVLGVLLILFGTAAILFPLAATLAVELLVGAVLVASGAVALVQAFGASGWKGFLLSLLAALLSLAVGAVLLFYPITGVISLTLLIGAFFFATGVVRVLLALRIRPNDQWGWIMVSGVLALILSALILLAWPRAAGWIIGLLVGVDLIFAGWGAVALGLAARRAG